MATSSSDNLSFWQHLDGLRSVLLRCLAAWAAGMIAAFCFKGWLFDVLFAPAGSDFVLYRALRRLAEAVGWQSLAPQPFEVSFINTELTQQFMTHLQVSLWAGLVVVFPYIISQVYGFITPALYDHERRLSTLFVVVGTLLFALGVVLNYLIIFPFSFRFLAGYQVHAAVVNQISLSSYIGSLLTLSLLMGLLFELPLLGWLLARLGVINAGLLKRYRRHAFVLICIVAAVITPTSDVFTLMLVTLPVYLLYELTILIVNRYEIPDSRRQMEGLPHRS